MKLNTTFFLLQTFLVSLPPIAEEEQKKAQKQPELTPVIRAMFASPGNRGVRVHDGLWPGFFGTKNSLCNVQDSRQPSMGDK